jgi:tetratricopeptide (TPR) repeat protein
MALTLEEALQKAIETHQSGQTQEAERLYSFVLNAQPNHPDANHNMGVLLAGVGKVQAALPLFKAALSVNPNKGRFWLSYINALVKLGRLGDAKQVLTQAKSKGFNGQAFKQLDKHFSEPSTNLQDPPSYQLDSIISFYTQGHLQQALSDATKLLDEYPNSAVLFNIAGASHAALMQFSEAIRCFRQSLKIHPDNAGTYNNIGNALRGKEDLKAAVESYKQALKIKPDYAEAYYNMGGALTDSGNSEAAIESYKQSIKINPNYAEAYANMGIVLLEKGDPEAAINSSKKALKIKPNFAEAYNTLGNALNTIGDLLAALDNYKQAVKVNPNYAEAFYNMGIALNDKGDLEVAINSYNKALKIKPDYHEAHNNMGIALNDKGDPEAAINSYSKALKIKPDYHEAQSHLITLLTTYAPQEEHQNLIITVNEVIRKINIKDVTSNIISDEKVTSLFSRASSSISIHGLEHQTGLSQTYRSNAIDLNCTRHMLVFNEHHIIPEFCFGCYKVQVEPRSIIELIKLFLMFDQIELTENNTRKCMIELRPEISGFYKGLIYCSGLEQANKIAEDLDTLITKSIGLGLHSKVKRGCSEYPISFPDYKAINNSGPQLMNYNKDWKAIEDDYDSKNPKHSRSSERPSISGLSTNDILIIRKWIDYAKGIGDSSAELINQNTVYHQDIYEKAKARLDTFQFN